MPEGDTVARQCRILHDALAGAVLTVCDLRVPRAATADLTGWRVHEVRPRGKHLLIRLLPPEPGTAPMTPHSHLMMDGIWNVEGKARARATPAPGRAPATRSGSCSRPGTRTVTRCGRSPTT
ncbi:DNA-formamidopyrimidine glycosylase family protein [Brachybacterium sp. GPGPB12]|uniref:DNA-formamidopyrimidine glycosylase family protein n=1 Tax=Brachybacterium sp. GPGPB12 TaxID=3023517 RepID=UPI0031345A02